MAAGKVIERAGRARGSERHNLQSYLWLVAAVLVMAAISNGAGKAILHALSNLDDAPAAPILAALVLFGGCSFVSFYATWKTPLPSFVVAIALGIAGHNLFAPIIADRTLLATLVTGCAAMVLFGGGLEMPLRNFLRLVVKIAWLAIPGVLVTGFAFSFLAGGAAHWLDLALAPAVVILLGAVLASTDPAAIIPVLEHVKFKRRDTKDIVVAESALNDVIGTLLTSAFFKLSLGTLTLAAAYESLAGIGTLRFLTEQVVFGVAFGVLGFGLLWLLAKLKQQHGAAHFGADQVYFLAAPILSFVGASLFGGSGFLATFMAGLLFESEEHMGAIENFFFQVIDGVAKPVIFVLLGALVDLHALLAYAPIGILLALIFMFVVRPAMVFLMLGAYALRRDQGRLGFNELLFISFVRETGAIPAVLLVTAVARVTAPLSGLVEIGMWVILLTLILAPPFTPWVARKLGVAE